MASSNSASAARSEKKPRAKTITWQGLKLKLPAELPPGVAFDIVEAEASDNPMSVLRTLRSILGSEQFVQVRYKFEELGEDAKAGDLIDAVFNKYGVGLGESSASAKP
jgi:hypothetical protein